MGLETLVGGGVAGAAPGILGLLAKKGIGSLFKGATGLGLASGGLKSILGLGQLIGGAFKKPKRPEYDIPQEAMDRLAMAKNNMNGRMAGAAGMEDNIAQSQGSLLDAARRGSTDSNKLLTLLASSQANTNRAYQGLQTREAMDQQRRLRDVYSAQSMMGQYKDKRFGMNKMQPYQDEARTKAALLQSGIMNTVGGVGDASNILGRMYMARTGYGTQGYYE